MESRSATTLVSEVVMSVPNELISTSASRMRPVLISTDRVVSAMVVVAPTYGQSLSRNIQTLALAPSLLNSWLLQTGGPPHMESVSSMEKDGVPPLHLALPHLTNATPCAAWASAYGILRFGEPSWR